MSYPAASATDAVGPVTITYSQASGTVFALGTTHVTVTAKDAAGNTSTGSFDVIVRDTIAPLLTVPATQTAEATSAAGASVSYPAASATDAVGVATITYSQASGAVFAARHDARHRHGEGRCRATPRPASFDVVVRDTIAPLLTVPATQTAEATSPAGAAVSYPAATATDAVGVASITYSQASGTVFPLGTTHVTVTANDAAGNTTTRLVRRRRPRHDRACADRARDANSSRRRARPAPGDYPAASATDAVGVVTITYSRASGAAFALGTTHVPVTAKDAAGNTTTGVRRNRPRHDRTGRDAASSPTACPRRGTASSRSASTSSTPSAQ